MTKSPRLKQKKELSNKPSNHSLSSTSMLLTIPLNKNNHVLVHLLRTDPIISIVSTNYTQKTLTLSPGDIEELSGIEISSNFQNCVYLSDESDSGKRITKICVEPVMKENASEDGGSDKDTYLKFMVERLTDQVNYTQVFTLNKECTSVLVSNISKIKEHVDFLKHRVKAIDLAVDIIYYTLGKLIVLYNVREGVHEFIYILKLLNEQYNLNVLENNYKDRSPGTLFNINEIFESILTQYDYVYQMYLSLLK